MGNVIQPVGLATKPRCAPLDTDRRKFFMMITVTFPLKIRVLMCISKLSNMDAHTYILLRYECDIYHTQCNVLTSSYCLEKVPHIQ